MFAEEDKCFYSNYETNIEVGNPVNFPGGSLIPIISVTSVYGGTTKHSCVGGGGIILDPLAIVVVNKNKLEICLIKPKKLYC
ncbi:hypothetical protein [Desulfotruncus alcoholivorax]|uniref:hypothetical protein n=1 Tax=Desulfotruncus alcoholivorax TaxID=265477 RepID=UPI000414E967|nr:hypothetical protein [Desulfotruncus alcoholivorax]